MSTNVLAQHIKELRERTGVGFMACKKALAECDNDLSAAIDYLRKNSGVKADGKAGRATSEGLIACAVDRAAARGVLVEINCETDFVARSSDFIGFADEVAQWLLEQGANGTEALLQHEKLEQLRTSMVQKLGENIRLHRCQELAGSTGCLLFSYLHSNRRIGTLVSLAGGDESTAKDIAMHVAAENPAVIAAEDVPQDLLQKEETFFRSQVESEGKPDHLIDRIVAGKVKKFAASRSLLQQEFIRDPGRTVEEFLQAAGATVTGFVRCELGEETAYGATRS